MTLRLVAIALLLVVAGCGQGTATPGKPDETMPGDFAGEVSYANGSVAPPYHYEWRVVFDARTATLTWTPGYEGTENWTETAEVDTPERLYARLDRAGLFEFTDTDDGLVGGPTGRARFGSLHDTGTLGTSEAGQDMLDEAVAAVEELFPADVWTTMEQRQRDWQPK
jgi:hypothetical protein